MAGIGKWKKELKYATEHLPIYSSVNADHPDCPHCGGTMNFYGHDGNFRKALGFCVKSGLVCLMSVWAFAIKVNTAIYSIN